MPTFYFWQDLLPTPKSNHSPTQSRPIYYKTDRETSSNAAAPAFPKHRTVCVLKAQQNLMTLISDSLSDGGNSKKRLTQSELMCRDKAKYTNTNPIYIPGLSPCLTLSWKCVPAYTNITKNCDTGTVENIL